MSTRPMSTVAEAEWIVAEALMRKAFKIAKKEARRSFEGLGKPTGCGMVRGPTFGIAVRIEFQHAEGT